MTYDWRADEAEVERAFTAGYELCPSCGVQSLTPAQPDLPSAMQIPTKGTATRADYKGLAERRDCVAVQRADACPAPGCNVPACERTATHVADAHTPSHTDFCEEHYRLWDECHKAHGTRPDHWVAGRKQPTRMPPPCRCRVPENLFHDVDRAQYPGRTPRKTLAERMKERQRSRGRVAEEDET